MSNIVSIHQPSYFPWLGLLDKINKSDIYIYMDNVQLADRAYQHRNIFLSNQGREHLLTISIDKKGYRHKSISEIFIKNGDWRRKHLSFFESNYKKHPYFDEIYEKIQPIYQKEYEYLNDFLFDSMQISLDIFKIDTKIIKASTLDIDSSLKKEDLIFGLLDKVGATTYLSGVGAKSYQDEKHFLDRGIELVYQEMSFLDYNQYKNRNFIKGLSSLDVAFNYGLDDSRAILGGE